MLLVYAALLILATVPLAGGRLGALADVPLRGAALVALALGTQVLIVSVIPGAGQGSFRMVHVATYAALAGFVWLNRRLPGVRLVALGALANAAAIVANGGVMPAAPGALAAAGLAADKPGEFANSAAVHAPALGFLGDVFAVPAAWGPAANVFSIGDLVIAAGLAVALHRLGGSRLAALGRRARPI
ncbi:MAG: hypothetical protein QOE28_1228 [Solirubrobacteraceae bacterium]|jgi:hypothetical protein|nr:hypothetical protein [Solirubrobacteraceae bacterium]